MTDMMKTTKEQCGRCLGRGYIQAYAHIRNGVCFVCGGHGTVTRSSRRGEKYAFGTADCFPCFWNKFTSEQKAANYATRKGQTIFMTEDEYHSRFSSLEEASAWAKSNS